LGKNHENSREKRRVECADGEKDDLPNRGKLCERNRGRGATSNEGMPEEINWVGPFGEKKISSPKNILLGRPSIRNHAWGRLIGKGIEELGPQIQGHRTLRERKGRQNFEADKDKRA